VHAKARPCVDLAYSPTGFAVGQGYVVRQKIDATDIEPDRIDRTNGHLAIVGVDDVGNIECGAARRQVGSRSQVNDLVLLQDRVLVIADLAE